MSLNGVILPKRPYINVMTAAQRPLNRQNRGILHMWRLIKAILTLAILAGLGLIAYAYVGPIFFPADFAAPTEQISVPVTLDTD